MGMTAVAETPVAHGTGIGDGILNVDTLTGWTPHDVAMKLLRAVLPGL
jgi:hypothetical protein